jgi:hypothetical protein
LYLDGDGIGALGGAPPPIGVRVMVAYNPEDNVLTLIATEQGKPSAQAQMIYDPSRGVITAYPNAEFHRRARSFSELMRRSLGLEPKSQRERS